MLSLLILLTFLHFSNALTPTDREKVVQDARLRSVFLPGAVNVTSYQAGSCSECNEWEKCLTQSKGALCECPYTNLYVETGKSTNKPSCRATPFYAKWGFFKANWGFERTEALMTDRPMTQADGSFSECFEGTFAFHQKEYGIYTCNFGAKFGRLFVWLSDVYGKACEHDHSKELFTAQHTFIPANTAMSKHGDSGYFPFYANDNRLWHYQTGCLVMGFYCLIENI